MTFWACRGLMNSHTNSCLTLWTIVYLCSHNRHDVTSKVKITIIMSPLSQRGGDMLLYLCPLSSSAQLVSVCSLLSYRRSNTRRWPNAGLMLAHCLQRWPSIKPALVQRFVFAGPLMSLIHFSPVLFMVQAVKHETLTQCWSNVGPPSTTLSKH